MSLMREREGRRGDSPVGKEGAVIGRGRCC